ncbi:MAG: DUF2834 domain-containing protein [Sulfuritalea sp.]|nr:DUF2834 domain-containing protein [Sulfuritalea sp.]
MHRTLIVITLVSFGALTSAALWQHGYSGILTSPLQSLAASQIFVDLLIALTLVVAWMWRDARASGRNAWPWIVVTLAIGSFGPLIYLLTRKSGAQAG